MPCLTENPIVSSPAPDILRLSRDVDAVIAGAIAARRIVGAVVNIVIDGEIVYRRAAGYADIEAARPMREDDLFRLASVSKLIVATAAMVLVARGRIDLDGFIDAWLPSFRPTLADGSATRITVRHLLTHTAGLSYGFLEAEDGPYHRADVSDGMDRVALTLAGNIERLGSVPLLFEPGSAWNYSLSIDVLGAVIEAASGMPLPEAVESLVGKPLGLHDTGFGIADAGRLAAAYADGPLGARRMRDDDRIPVIPGLAAIRMDPARAFDADAFPSGGAGMIGTVHDVATLLETLRLGGGTLMPASLAAEMTSNNTGELPIAGWPGWGYGLGFSVLKDPALAGTPESPGTWRWGGAYGHSWFVDPVRRITAVAFTNTALEGMSGGGRFPVDLTRAIYG